MPSTNRIVSSEAEELILVDEDDQPVGQVSKAAAHNGDGQLHRAFSVFLFNADGEVLLQRRAPGKRLWPGFWSNSCCSHPRVGESMATATRRRLEDELNLVAELEFVYRFQYQARYGAAGSENELCHVYLGRVTGDVVPNEREIDAIRFIRSSDVAGTLEKEPEQFTPWFKLEWQRLTDEHAGTLRRYAEPLQRD